MFPTGTVADSIWPSRTLLGNLILIVGGSIVLALLSQVKVPLLPVPITLQTFGVLLIGLSYGSRLGALTLAAYLAEGAAGLPVFAGGAGGFQHLGGPTAGYLWGFLAAAWVVGYLVEQGWNRSILFLALAALVGNIMLYVPGLLWLNYAFLQSWEKTIAVGLVPFLLGDVIKLVLAVAILHAAHRFTDRSKGSPV